MLCHAQIVNATSTMLLLRQAVFCPAPTGDSITRKSLFDSLVAGCIPVLFSRASLAQYSWHLSEQDVSSCAIASFLEVVYCVLYQLLNATALLMLLQVDRVSVYIPMSKINEQNANFLEILRAIPSDEVRRKQQHIASIAPTLQYSIVRNLSFDFAIFGSSLCVLFVWLSLGTREDRKRKR